jgi:hypothetical protein
MLSITLTTRQERELSALAYWIADAHYITERFGHNEPEHQTADLTVRACFDALDALGVPYWMQNAVVMFSEDWRRYKSDNWLLWLNRRVICGERAYNIAVEG